MTTTPTLPAPMTVAQRQCPHESLSVSYSAPVQVIVRDGEVSRVVVVDEGIGKDATGYIACDDCYLTIPADHPLAVAAYEAAESSDGWPSWDIGW